MKTSPLRNASSTRLSLQQLIKTLQQREINHSVKERQSQQIRIDHEEVRKSLKKSWKGSGPSNKEFAKFDGIRAKMLSNWEIQRMPLSKRSFIAPKGSKGFRFDSHSRQFASQSNKQLYPAKFKDYINKMEEQFEDKLFKPKPIENNKLSALQKLSASSMKFTTSNGFFGTPFKQGGLNTLKTYKSEIFTHKK